MAPKRTNSLSGTEVSSVSDRDDLSTTSHSDSAGATQKLCGILTVRTQEESLAITRSPPASSSSSPSSDDDEKRKPGVKFSTVRFREYERCPGDNPAVRAGVPFSLNWEVLSDVTAPLEAYESSRPPRRERAELNIPPDIRFQMMRNAGHSRQELQEYMRLANIARGQRTRTNETQQLAPAQEFTERLVRGFLNKSFRKQKKLAEKQMIQEHLERDQKQREMRIAQPIKPKACI
jgi:hypothetical protein